MPPQIRASMTSSRASEKRLNVRRGIGTPLRDRPVTRVIFSLSWPKNLAIVVSTAPLMQPWPDGWSGNGGVARGGVVAVSAANSDSQFGSATVFGLPSVSASRIAALGRQKCQKYLSFQQAIAASAAARLTIP